MVLLVGVSSACGSSESTSGGEGAGGQVLATPQAPVSQVEFAHADFGTYFEDIEAMGSVTVVVGQVTAEKDGPAAPEGDGEHSTKELRRTITIGVSRNITGDDELRQFDVVTPGWIVRDGQRTPLTYQGWPWLQVGDKVLLAVDDPSGDGNYSFMSDSGVHIFRDGKIEAVPGDVSKLSQSLVGMTEQEVADAFSRVGQ